MAGDQESWGVRVGVILLMLTGLTVPLSTSLGCTVFPFAAMGVWLVSGRFLNLPTLLRDNPVAALCAGLFVWLAAAAFYSEVDGITAFKGLKKYRELFFAPIFMGFLAKAADRRRVLHALAVGLGLALVISFTQVAGLVPLYKEQATSSSSITHGLLMAWLAFWLMHEGRRRGGWLAWAGVALVAADLFLFVHATTGIVLFMAGIGLFIWQVLPIRRAALVSLAVLLVPLVFFLGSVKFRGLVQSDWRGWHQTTQNAPAHGGVGERLVFWRHTTAIILDAPLLGHGTGSYTGRYKQIVSGKDFPVTTNAHNEYLMLWAQAGLPAFLLFLCIFIWQWRQAEGVDRLLAHGFVVLFGLGCAFNSFILDSREGILFALLTAVLYPAPAQGWTDAAPEES